VAEENTNVANDSTNAPQTSQDNTATQPAGVDAPETMLGGNGTTEQQQAPGAETQAPQEQYDFAATIPEGMDLDETITKEFSDIAHGLNLNNEQANQIAAYGIKYAQQAVDAVKAQYNAEVQQWGEAAKAEMGADMEKVMSTAGAGIEAAEKTIPGIRKALNETGAGNRIEVIRAFEMLGQLVMADPGKLANAGGTAAPTPAKTWYPNSDMS